MAGERYVTVARVEDVPAGRVVSVSADGEQLALAHVDGSFHATQNACIHLEGPLADGRLDGHTLTCPWHGWQYDVRSGRNLFDGAIRLRTYAVRVQDGEIQVALDA